MVDSAAWPRQLGSARLAWRATILQMKKCVSTVFPPTEQNQTGLNIVLQCGRYLRTAAAHPNLPSPAP
jgi:hypothetical protein